MPISDIQQLGPEGAPDSRFAFFNDPDGNGWAVQEYRNAQSPPTQANPVRSCALRATSHPEQYPHNPIDRRKHPHLLIDRRDLAQSVSQIGSPFERLGIECYRPDQIERHEMTNLQAVGYTTVAPWVVTKDTSAFLDFVGTAFQGADKTMVPPQDGSIGHGEITVGDTRILAFDLRAGWPPLPALLRVWVADADTTLDRAVAAGAEVVTPMSDSAFGQRGGRLRDPFGNIWWVSAQIEDVPFEEAMGRLTMPTYQASMDEAQTSLDFELGGGGTSVDITPETPS